MTALICHVCATICWSVATRHYRDGKYSDDNKLLHKVLCCVYHSAATYILIPLKNFISPMWHQAFCKIKTGCLVIIEALARYINSLHRKRILRYRCSGILWWINRSWPLVWSEISQSEHTATYNVVPNQASVPPLSAQTSSHGSATTCVAAVFPPSVNKPTDSPIAEVEYHHHSKLSEAQNFHPDLLKLYPRQSFAASWQTMVILMAPSPKHHLHP